MIEARKHIARGVDVELGVSENGKEQVAIRFRIEAGSDQGDEIAWFGFFTDKTAERTLESLRYCGWDTHDLGDLSAEVIGRNLVQIVVEHETYQNKTRAKVSWVNRLGGPLVKHGMDKAKRAEFAARMRGLAMKIDPKLAQPTEVEPHRGATGRSNARAQEDPGFEDDGGFGFDDIPF